ncbi:MAG: L-threonylcarbamoyladenylate synthase, partial [Halobacteriaceae archaeon]
ASERRMHLAKKLRDCLFIHPTDTVYGIGCNATNRSLVQDIRDAKRQHERPVSVIAPGIEWMEQHCHIPEQASDWIDKLPGPYTFILPLQDRNAVADNVNLNKETIGVRFPDHWFTEVVKHIQHPVVTTSANVTGRDYMEELEDLDDELAEAVDVAVYEGPISGTPSKIIDFTQDQPTVLRD